MALETTSFAPYVTPDAAAGLNITPSAISWDNSAWVEFIASTANDILIYGMTFTSPNMSNTDGEVDVGVGAATSEVAIGTLKWGGSSSTPFVLRFNLPLFVASGSRVAMRMRKTGTSTTNQPAKLLYYDIIPSGIQYTTALCNPYPSAGTIGITVAASWGAGTWVEIEPSAPADLVLNSIAFRETLTSNSVTEIDIGIGASGFETVITQVRYSRRFALGYQPHIVDFNPLIDAIPAGSRIAVRGRRNTTGTNFLAVGITAYSKPL